MSEQTQTESKSELAQRIEAPDEPKSEAGKLLRKTVYAYQEHFALALTGADGKPLIAPEKFARVAFTAIRKNEMLMEATHASLFGALMTIAQLGLEPSGPLEQAYLVPFRDNKAKTIEVQVIIGYRGFIQLAYRSGMVASIGAHVVHDGDAFDWEYGSNEFLRHKPRFPAQGEVTGSWSLAKLVTGGTPFVVLDRAGVDKARAQAKTDKIWKSDFEAMARKTAVRQLFRWLPASVEVQGALGADQGVVRGIPESVDDFGEVIDVEGVED